MKTLEQVLQAGREYLKAKEIVDADIDAWYLLSHVFAISRTEFYMRQQEAVDEAKLQDYQLLLERRALHEPLQYILKTQEFMGLEFLVNPNVLIPRQETEELVVEILKDCKGKEVLDMCTGSGCIIVSLAKLSHLKKATAVDISVEALQVAKQNASKHQVDIEFIESNLFENVDGCYDIIVSNPPYIPSDDVDELMPEVKDFEPRIALDGTEDGLFFYREIIKASKEHLRQAGSLYFEIGYNQGAAIKDLLLASGFRDIKVMKDFSGHDRMVWARKI